MVALHLLEKIFQDFKNLNILTDVCFLYFYLSQFVCKLAKFNFIKAIFAYLYVQQSSQIEVLKSFL